MTLTTGIERLLADPAPWVAPGQRVGLLTNPTGVDRQLRSTIDLLHEHRGVTLVRLYGPEHGIRGDAQAGVPVEDDIDPRTQLPVTSLYAKQHGTADDAFDDIDMLVIDLQDAGVRYYTYLASANSATRRATAAGKRVLILDRPNPIAWMGVWGNRVADDAGSIVGLAGLPVTHGASMGEMLRWLAHRDDRDLPEVVQMDGWSRQMQWHETGLPWVPPSPNLPTLDSIHAYPATCLIEGTSWSEGRGTTLPFEWFGAPNVDESSLVDTLNKHSPAGYRLRPTTFVPTFSKHNGELCRGAQLHRLTEHHPSIVAFGPRLIHAIRNVGGAEFRWTQFGDRYFLDRLAGGSELRETIDADGDIDTLTRRWTEAAGSFVDEVDPYLMYGPLILQEDVA